MKNKKSTEIHRSQKKIQYLELNRINEREILFDSKNFSKVSPFYGSMICLFDIAHQTFTLPKFIAASMVVKELVAAQVDSGNVKS